MFEREWCYDFFGAGDIPTSAGQPFIYVKPTGAGSHKAAYAASDHGAGQVIIANDNEAARVALYQGDVLQWDLNKLKRVEFVARIATALGTGVVGVLGLGTARNNTLDSVATNAWFRWEASGATLVETDDGTRDVDDVASGITLSSTYKRFVIDFTKGLGDVRFYMDGANGALQEIKRPAGAIFDMSAAAASNNRVQLMCEMQKGATTDVGVIEIDQVKVLFVAA